MGRIADLITSTATAMIRRDTARVELEAQQARGKNLSRLDSITNTLTGLGNTSADRGASARPDTSRYGLSTDELTYLWSYNAYARKIVSIIPGDATKKGWNVVDSTNNPGAMKREDDRLGVQTRVAAAHTWARLYGGSCVMMVTDGGGPDLSKPMNLSSVRNITNLVVLDAFEAVPFEYDGDVRSPGYRDPLLWSVTPYSRAMSTTMKSGERVHASRMLYFPGAKQPPSRRYMGSNNAAPDRSILDVIWDQVRNQTSVDQAAATTAQDFRIHIMRIMKLSQKKVAADASDFNARMKAIAQGLGVLNMVLLGPGEEFSTNHTSVAGFKELQANAMAALSCAADIPMTRLFGLTPQGLNSDGESWQRMYSGTIGEIQNRDYRDPLRQLYEVLYNCSEGPTGGRVPDEWEIVFNPIFEATAQEEAETRKTRAETDQIYIDSGVLTAEQVRESRFGAQGYQEEILPTDTDTDIDTDPVDDEVDDTRIDADEDPGACIVIPIRGKLLNLWQIAKGRAEQAAGPLGDPGAPHVTLLYLGRDVAQETLDHVSAIIADEASRLFSFDVWPGGVGVLGEAAVLELHSWGLEALHGRLLHRLAHLVSEPQYATYKPHATLGYYRGNDEGVLASLLQLGEDPLWPEPDGTHLATSVELWRGDERLGTWALTGSRLDAKAPRLATVVAPHSSRVLDEDWRHDEAMDRVRDWAVEEGRLNQARMRSACAWYDAARRDAPDAYQLLHHDVRDGELVVNPEAVKDALLQVSGVLDGKPLRPVSLRVRVEAHLRRHLREHMAEERQDAAEDLPSDWQPAGRFKGLRTLNLRRLGTTVSRYYETVAGLWDEAREDCLDTLNALPVDSSEADIARAVDACNRRLDALLASWLEQTEPHYREAEKIGADAASRYAKADMDPDARAALYLVLVGKWLEEAGSPIGTVKQRIARAAEALPAALAVADEAPLALEQAVASAGDAFDAQKYRINNYSGRLVEQASESFRDGLLSEAPVTIAPPDGAPGGPVPDPWYYEWVAVGSGETCPTCQAEARAGVRRVADMRVVPGGKTECGARCRCVLVMWRQSELEGKPSVTVGAPRDDAAEKYSHINFKPPEGVREELERGLQWHEEGHGGEGLRPATVAWARRLAGGENISPDKAGKMRAWLARHEVDKEGKGFAPGEDGFPSPGRVAWALWGGDPAVSWSSKLVEQMEAADE